MPDKPITRIGEQRSLPMPIRRLPPVCLDRYVDWTCISAPGTGQERETGHARGTGPEARPFPAAFEVERCVDWQAERGMGNGP